MILASASPDIVLLFAGAGLVLYVASRAAADALTQASEPSPGRMALGQWMPIACVSLLATGAGHAEIGIGLAFATSVAALSLCLGVLLILGKPMRELPSSARAWPFVLPAALLPLLGGLTSTLSILHALMLLMLGVSVAMVWRWTPPGEIPLAQEARPRPLGKIQLFVAILLGVVGAWLAYHAVMAADSKTRVATSGLISAAIIAPLLVLPILGTGAIAGNNGRMDAVLGNLTGVTLLNLCLLLPLVIILTYARNVINLWRSGTQELGPLLEQLRAVPFPLGVWRLDNVLLVVLGMMLIPISLGRWKLTRGEGLALVLGYVAYLIASAALVVRV